MAAADLWEPFTPPAALRRREAFGWLGYVQAVGPPVPAVDARSGPVPVLTVPGFLTGDWSMIPPAMHLRRMPVSAGSPVMSAIPRPHRNISGPGSRRRCTARDR